ncbi:MAG TPA: hypothetical protein PLP27_07195, partial [Crocinitomicaceae bacterium]|nr:hypothetical protein [Crocinitomicaceae bacterium]
MRNFTLHTLIVILLTSFFSSNINAQQIVDEHEVSEALYEHFDHTFKNDLLYNQDVKYYQVYFDQNADNYLSRVYRLLGKTSGTVTKQQMDNAVSVVAREFVTDFKKLPKKYFDHIDYLDSTFANKKPKKEGDDGFVPKGPGDPCQNMGFESNNFSGWELYYGTRTTGNFTTSGWTAGTNAPINNSGGTAAQHAIVTAGNDPNIGAA